MCRIFSRDVILFCAVRCPRSTWSRTWSGVGVGVGVRARVRVRVRVRVRLRLRLRVRVVEAHAARGEHGAVQQPQLARGLLVKG